MPDPEPANWDDPDLTWDMEGLTWDGPKPLNINNTMDPNNRISATLSAADITAILAAVETLITKLPFLVGLTPEERHDLPKLGTRSVAFIDGIKQIVDQHPEIFPAVFSIAEFGKDYDLNKGMLQIAGPIRLFCEKFEDTLLLVGSETYLGGLEGYRYAKAAGQTGGLDSLLTPLASRFSRKSKSTGTTPPPNP
jgi:hypothetical protein